MGPLVPELIGNELNFVVAFFIGVAFGFILEQAGFSTSKKLVGLFYGYDFTVLRVFFTAGVTAMLGVIALAHFGLLDISLIYINPTFLWSAIIGGLIMGLGFVVGGFCPGTSVCAAAIGKIDAMIFVAGSFLGVLIFAEGYPLFEGVYKAASWGNVTIFNTLGMSQSLFAFLLTFIAVFAFWITTLIENKVNGKKNPEFTAVPLYVGLTGIAMILGLSAFFLPNRKEAISNKLSDAKFVVFQQVKSITSDELAFRIVDDDPNLQIIDIRTLLEYDSLSLPKSTHFTIDNLFEKDAYNLLSVKHKKNVFVANEELSEKKAAIIANELGFNNVFVLKGGLSKFKTDILQFKMPAEITDRWVKDTYIFRERASKVIPELIKQYKLKQTSVPEKKKKRILGGC
jgi:rhodanese-related sulfurtransferase